MKEQKRRRRSLKARNKLVEQWSGLPAAMVKKVWHKRVIKRLGFEDAVQVGMFGLIASAAKYDATRGAKFSTYAAKGILRAIFKVAYTQQSLVMLPETRPTPESLAPYVDQAKHCYLCSVLPEIEDKKATWCFLAEEDHRIERAKLDKAISMLGERNGQVFADWLRGKKTIRIAAEQGVSKQRIHQLLHNAIKKIFSLLKNRDSDEDLLPTTLLQVNHHEL